MDLLMKDRDTAQFAAGPFCLVLVHVRVYGLEKGPDEGCFECGANN